MSSTLCVRNRHSGAAKVLIEARVKEEEEEEEEDSDDSGGDKKRIPLM